MKAKSSLFLLGVMLLPVASHAAPEQRPQMKFRLHAPDRLERTILGTAWDIYATGPIDRKAPVRLLSLIKKNQIPAYSTVYLSSPGGNLDAGMKLGQIIRSHHFNTEVGSYEKNSTHLGPGDCYSACALALLGGKWRFFASGSRYGVHRFYFARSIAGESDLAQEASAAVVQYIRDMGADPALFTAMTLSGKDEITLIPLAELKKLNVINDGVSATLWSIQSARGTLYLKGQRDTVYGINKFILGCAGTKPILYVIFDPQGRGNEVIKMTVISLMVNGKRHPIEDSEIGKTRLVDGWINAAFLLTPSELNEIASARTIGVAFQASRTAMVFLGFDGMSFKAGAAKMGGVLRDCYK